MIRVRLQELLKERKKSRYWLGQQTGLTPQTITKLFRGDSSKIELETLNKICEALDCKTSDVLEFVREPEQKKGK